MTGEVSVQNIKSCGIKQIWL